MSEKELPIWCEMEKMQCQGCKCLANTGYFLPVAGSGFCIGLLDTTTVYNFISHNNTHVLCIRGPLGSGGTFAELVVPIALTLGDVEVLISLFEEVMEER